MWTDRKHVDHRRMASHYLSRSQTALQWGWHLHLTTSGGQRRAYARGLYTGQVAPCAVPAGESHSRSGRDISVGLAGQQGRGDRGEAPRTLDSLWAPDAAPASTTPADCGADLNSRCHSIPGLIGRGVLPTASARSDSELLEFIRSTWSSARPRHRHTYSNGPVRTQLDYILVRRATADRLTKMSWHHGVKGSSRGRWWQVFLFLRDGVLLRSVHSPRVSHFGAFETM